MRQQLLFQVVHQILFRCGRRILKTTKPRMKSSLPPAIFDRVSWSESIQTDLVGLRCEISGGEIPVLAAWLSGKSACNEKTLRSPGID